MTRLFYARAVVALLVFPAAFQAPVAGQAGSAASANVNPRQALLNSYCVGCHNSRGKAGGLVLEP